MDEKTVDVKIFDDAEEQVSQLVKAGEVYGGQLAARNREHILHTVIHR